MAPQSSSILTISGGFVGDFECLRTICDHDEGDGEGARVVRVVSLGVTMEVRVRVRVWGVDMGVKEGECEDVGEGYLRVWVRFMEGVRVVILRLGEDVPGVTIW